MWWLWIVLGVVLVVGVIAIIAAVILGRRQEKQAVTDAAAQYPQSAADALGTPDAGTADAGTAAAGVAAASAFDASESPDAEAGPPEAPDDTAERVEPATDEAEAVALDESGEVVAGGDVADDASEEGDDE